MTDTTTIPLNKLLAWDGNVRKTDPDKGIDELAASISAHGLLAILVVRKDKRGKVRRRRGAPQASGPQSPGRCRDREHGPAHPCTVIKRRDRRRGNQPGRERPARGDASATSFDASRR